MSFPVPDTSTYERVHKASLDWMVTRRTLIDRLRDKDDHQSWNQFFATYSKLIYGFALRTGLTKEEAQEVVQETVISFSKNAEEYQYDPEKGSFKSWLLKLTRWRIQDQFRRRSRDPILDSAEPYEDAGKADSTYMRDIQEADFRTLWEEEWRENVLAVAIDRVKKVADPRHYQAFELYVLRNMSASVVQERLRIGRGLLYVYKHRISKMIQREIKALEREGSS